MTMGDDTTPTENKEMQQILSMMQGLHTGMDNINSRLTLVEQQKVGSEASYQMEPPMEQDRPMDDRPHQA